MTVGDRDVIRHFLAPEAIAIVGASQDENSTSGRPLHLLLQHQYGGAVFVVNPAHKSVAGLPCYSSVKELPEKVDVALVTVRAEHVPGVLRDCAESGIPAAYIISSGFNEAPETKLGQAATKGLEDVLGGSQLRITGPNAEGIYNVIDDIPLGFSPVMGYDQALRSKPRPGNVAVVAQSGGLGFGIFHQGMVRGIDFSYIVSTGNEVDLGLIEYVDYFIEDSHTSVVVAFMEGVDRPSELRELGLRATAVGKRIVVAKVGRSIEAQRAAVSHTGHVTGPSHLWSALFRSAGILEVSDMTELLDVVAALARWPSGTGNRVCIVTGSGGAGVWMTDALRSEQLEVPELEPDLQAALTPLLPYYASARNPVDMTAGGGGLDSTEKVLSLVGASECLDVIVVISSLAKAESAEERCAMYGRVAQQIDKPLLAYSYTQPIDGTLDAFARIGVPVYLSQAGLARAIAALARQWPVRQDPAGLLPPPKVAPLPDSASDSTLVGPVLHEAAVKDWLAECGLALPRRHLARDADEAVSSADEIGYPVALKAQSSLLPHKRDAGVLALNLASAGEVREAWSRLHAKAVSLVGQKAVAGLLAEEMVAPGFEMLVGVTSDPLLGVYLTVGPGGSNAELFGDVAILVAPATRDQVQDALGELRCAKVFDPSRPEPVDVDAFCELAAAVSAIAAETTGLGELDLNPVIVHRKGEGVIVVDALAVCEGVLQDGATLAGLGAPFDREPRRALVRQTADDKEGPGPS